MSMKAGIRTYLLADSTIKNALATVTAVYSFPAPMGAAMPYLLLSRVSGGIQNTLNAVVGIYIETWQVDVYASTDAVAENIRDKVIKRMNTADRVAMGEYWVYSASLTGATDNSELEMDGGESAIIRHTLDFEIVRNIDPTPTGAGP